MCSHASRGHVACLLRGVSPSMGLPPPPLPGPTFDDDGSTTRCPDRIRRPAVGIGRLGTRSTRATVACYATTTDNTHLGGILPWDANTDVAGATTIAARTTAYSAVAAVPVRRIANWPELGAMLWHSSHLALVTRISCVPSPLLPPGCRKMSRPATSNPVPRWRCCCCA